MIVIITVVVKNIIIIVLYLTLVKIQIHDKTNHKSHNLKLGLFTPRGTKATTEISTEKTSTEESDTSSFLLTV